MPSSTKLMDMAKRWRLTSSYRRSCSSGGGGSKVSASTSPTGPVGRQQHRVACKGHFVAYTADGARFEVPLSCLRDDAILELLRQSQEEFGPPRDGPIRLVCDGEFLVRLLQPTLGKVGGMAYEASSVHSSVRQLGLVA